MLTMIPEPPRPLVVGAENREGRLGFGELTSRPPGSKAPGGKA